MTDTNTPGTTGTPEAAAAAAGAAGAAPTAEERAKLDYQNLLTALEELLKDVTGLTPEQVVIALIEGIVKYVAAHGLSLSTRPKAGEGAQGG